MISVIAPPTDIQGCEIHEQPATLGSPKGTVQIDDVARELNMSAKTLERRLADRKTTFSALLDDMRSGGLAKHYLTDATFPG
jgi:AraC-like DNA-binding protein